jgi:hypothetical protein
MRLPGAHHTNHANRAKETLESRPGRTIKGSMPACVHGLYTIHTGGVSHTAYSYSLDFASYGSPCRVESNLSLPKLEFESSLNSKSRIQLAQCLSYLPDNNYTTHTGGMISKNASVVIFLTADTAIRLIHSIGLSPNLTPLPASDNLHIHICTG